MRSNLNQERGGEWDESFSGGGSSGYGEFRTGGTRTEDTTRTPSQDPRLAGYYANLEVPYGSDLEAVRRAWKRLVKKYHPDLHGGDLEKRKVANELTAELTQAYRELEQALTAGKV